MKKFILSSIVVFGLIPFGQYEAAAQQAEMRFYYIMKDSYSFVSPLTRALREEFESAVSDKNNASIFYLPNSGGNPQVVKVNLPGDNRNDFDNLIYNLSQGDHTVSEERDIENIIRLFGENDFLNAGGSLKYKLFEMYVYVTPDYELRSNFIPRLYFALDLDSLPEKQFLLRILYGENDEFEFDEAQPFGNWGICTNYLISTY